jgi:hypothetical protein
MEKKTEKKVKKNQVVNIEELLSSEEERDPPTKKQKAVKPSINEEIVRQLGDMNKQIAELLKQKDKPIIDEQIAPKTTQAKLNRDPFLNNFPKY